MQRWEYTVISFETENPRPSFNPMLVSHLNSLGQERWELVGVISYITTEDDDGTNTRQVQLLFKRPVAEST